MLHTARIDMSEPVEQIPIALTLKSKHLTVTGISDSDMLEFLLRDKTDDSEYVVVLK